MVLNGSYSDYSIIKSGVPQGLVLCPLLFLLYINHLERNIKSNISIISSADIVEYLLQRKEIQIFFADDTMVFSIVNDPIVSADDLNHDLDIIHRWAPQWKMEFIPDPTQQATEVLFSCKKSSPNHPLLIFNGTAVANVNEQKHLGLVLDSGLSFEKHLTQKILKAKKNIGLIKHLQTRDQMYKALVRPLLDYCDIIYHEPPQLNQPPLGKTLISLMAKVERVQYQAALTVTGAWHGSNHSKRNEELGWENLSDCE